MSGADPDRSTWRSVVAAIGLAVGGLVAVAIGPVAWITAGLGGLVAVVVAAGLGLTWAVRRPARNARRASDDGSEGRRPPVDVPRAVRSVAMAAILALGIWNGVSAAWYVTHNYPDDPLQQRLATWGRNHGLSPVIDWLETFSFNEPPSAAPADQLTLGVAGIGTTTTVDGSDDVGPSTTEPDATTTTVDPGPQPPDPLLPVFDPPLGGEGQWTPIASAGGYPALWATSVRPLADAGAVVGSLVVIDQTYLRAGMFNGEEEPGGDWARDDRVPPELYPSLVAAMNGGFRFEHVKGGYVTEGKVVKPLRDGDATLAVSREDGRLVIGKLGREILDDGSWLSIRQNLTLMVDEGTSWVQWGRDNGTFWGANYGRDVYVNRSGVCELADGRLMYLMVGPVSAEQFADAMINVGCRKGIQLDINGTWPNFFTFQKNADGSVLPIFLDTRMGSNTYRYIKGSSKEFFAFFDASLVPAQSVLDI